jgi:hypothetical protein
LILGSFAKTCGLILLLVKIGQKWKVCMKPPNLSYDALAVSTGESKMGLSWKPSNGRPIH